MNLKNYLQFLNELNETRLALGFRVLNLIPGDKLAEEQHIYRFQLSGLGKSKEQWNPDWLVIGHDEMGMPVFANIKEKDWPVFTGTHDDKGWNVYKIAPDLGSFFRFLSWILPFCEGREDMEKLREHPIDEKKADEVIDKIEKQVQDGAAWYWELWLQNYPAEDEDESTFFA